MKPPEHESSPEQLMCRALVGAGAADGCGVSLAVDGGDRRELAATDETVSDLAELQFSLWEGPCPDAIESRTAVFVEDLLEEHESWPVLVSQLDRVPVRGLAVFPIAVDGMMAAFTAYWRTPHRCSPDEAAALGSYSSALAVVARFHFSAPPYDVPDSPIPPAVGMVMAHAQLNPHDALALLRSRAFAQDTTAADLARRLLTGDLRVEDVVELPE